MSKTKIIRNKTLKEYKDTYPNYKDLDKHTEVEVNKNKDLLKDKTWWLIDNTYYEAKDEKKKNAIAAWWSNLGKGARTAICVLGGAAVITGITVPTVFAVKSCTPSVRKIIVNGEVTHTSEFKADGSLKATINPTDPNKEISKLDIKIGDYTLKENEYEFIKVKGELTIAADIINAHKGNVVITPTLIEFKLAYIDWDSTNFTIGGETKTLSSFAKSATKIIFKKDSSTDGVDVSENTSENKIYASYATGTFTIWSNSKIAFEDDDNHYDGYNYYGPFFNCNILESIDFLDYNIDTSSMTNMSYMFNGCSKLGSLNLISLNTSNVSNMENMFGSCEKLIHLNLSSFDTKKVTNMYYMFGECNLLESLDLLGFDTSNVVRMDYMFSGCNKLTTLDLSSFSTSKVTDMGDMFSGGYDKNILESITFGEHFDTSNVTYMGSMFNNCVELTTLDLSTFIFGGELQNSSAMFSGCSKLKTIYAKDGTDLNSCSKLTNSNNMFNGCVLLKGGDGTEYDSNNIKKEYARIDKKNSTPSEPGYFTKK